MPRPRKHILPLSDLECFENLRSELQSKPELADLDIDTAIITLKQRKQPYTAQPENLEKSLVFLIYNLKRFPYQIHYLLEDKVVMVFGVFHGSSDPNSWEIRLKR